MTEEGKNKKTLSGRKKIWLFAGIGAAVLIAAAVALILVFAGKKPAPGSADETTPSEETTPYETDEEPTTEEVRTGVWHCVCGVKEGSHLPDCDGREVEWQAWNEANALPVSSGYYYLDRDVELLTSEHVANVTGSAIIYLDLYGHTVRSETRVYRMANAGTNVDLTFLDSEGGGKIVMDKHPNGATLVLLDASGAKSLTFYGGTYDGSALNAVGEDGKTEKNGGLIRVTGGKLSIHGGVFIGAKGANAGGTIYVQSAECKMTGGEVRDGSALNAGNIMLRKAAFEMTGGLIAGGVAAGAKNSRGGNIFSDQSSIRLTGNAEVRDGKAEAFGDNVFTNLIEEFFSDANVHYTDREGDGVYPIPLSAEDPNHHVCICGSKTSSHFPGCNGTKYDWRPWTSATSLPVTSGKYYLAADVTISVTAEVTAAAEIFLDLNGHKITGLTRVYQMSSAGLNDTLTVSDSAGGGRVILKSAPDGAAFATIGNTGEKLIRIYGGTYDASAINAPGKNGAFLRVGSASSSFALRNGTIIGGYAENGGAVYINKGKMVMTGGIIRDGSAKNGGNIIIGGGTLNMTGGQILRGHATMTTGELGRGGNIFNNDGTLKVSGSAKIADGTAVGSGPNIFSKGDSYKTTVAEGLCVLSEGGDGIFPKEALPEDPDHKVCLCGSKTDTHLPGCDGGKTAFRPWTETDSLPVESGKYYLKNDVEIAATAVISKKEDIVLDLNGHTIKASMRIYQIASAKIDDSLTILDSEGGGSVVMDTYTDGATFAAIGNTGAKTVTIYGGTFDASKIDATGKNGAFFRVGSATSALNIHGGTVIGGIAENGGAVYVTAGSFTMTGGVIQGGSAKNGGNLLFASGSTAVISGGEVKGGNATMTTGELGRGGNIFNNASKLTVTDAAKIYDGTAVGKGPNLFSLGEYESTIAEGACFFTEAEGDGIYPLTSGEEPGDEPGGDEPGGDEPGGEEDPNGYCICGSKTEAHLPGCDGTKKSFTAWTDATTLPAVSGYFALDQDVTIAATVTAGNGANIVLDLNGKTVTATTRVYNLAAKDTAASLTILDSAGGGKIVLTDYNAGGTLAVLGNSGNKALTIYGGTIDATAIEASAGHGGVARAATTGSFSSKISVHGGTILAGKASGTYYGGAFYINPNCTLEMTGGEIIGGESKNGGNIYLNGASTMTMSGGTVKGGTSTNLAGNIYLYNGASLILSGGTIEGGTSVGAGNLLLNDHCTLTMTGGTIKDGLAETGGNIRIQNGCTITMSGGSIFNGQATTGGNPRGGNILNNGCTVSISGEAKVYDGTATNGGGNIYNIGEYTLNVAEGTVCFTEGEGDGIYPVSE